MDPRLGETGTYNIITSLLAGPAVDADAPPTIEVFEEVTDTGIFTATSTKRTGKTGHYRVQVPYTTGNGFEVGKSYSVVTTGTVSGQAGCKATIDEFILRPAYHPVNVLQWVDDDVPAPQQPGYPMTDQWWLKATGIDPVAYVSASLDAILGSAITEDVTGRLALGFKFLLDVATRRFNLESFSQTGDSFARLGTPANATVSQDLLAIVTAAAAILDDTGTSGVAVAAGSKTGYALSSAGLDAVLIESGITPGDGLTNDADAQLTSINARQAIAIAISALNAVLAGGGTGTITTKPAGKPGASDRITATVDSNRNRTAVNLKVPT